MSVTVKRRARSRAPDGYAEMRAQMRPGIERDTELMPWLVAESVRAEASVYLDVAIPRRYEVWLDAFAERLYARNPRFRRQLRQPVRGHEPRDLLFAFMRHWLTGWLHIERPDLHQRLPVEYAIGHPLPNSGDAWNASVSPHAKLHFRAKPPLKPMRWSPQRLLDRPRWAWLAACPV
jgi:hypothetical protein